MERGGERRGVERGGEGVADIVATCMVQGSLPSNCCCHNRA